MACLPVLAAILCISAPATGVEFRFTPAGAARLGPAAPQATVLLRCTGASEGPREASIEVREWRPVTWDMQSGERCQATLRSLSWWAAALDIESQDDSPKVFKIWPAGRLRGAWKEVVPAPQVELPLPHLELMPVAGAVDPRRQPRLARVGCFGRSAQIAEAPARSRPVPQDRWECVVPAGRWQLRLEAPGFAPHQVWELRVGADELVALGAFPLVRGATVLGEVSGLPALGGSPGKGSAAQSGQAPAAASSPEVKLYSRRLGERPGPLAAVASAPVDASGRYQIPGVAPGDYTLVLHLPAGAGHNELHGEVQLVVSRSQSLVLAPELQLNAAEALLVYVDPPQPPGVNGAVWTLESAAFYPADSTFEPLASVRCGNDGVCELPTVFPGYVELKLLWPSGDRAYDHVHDLRQALAPVFVELALVAVEGEILLGRQGVRASLAFGGEMGAQSTLMTSSGDGRFSGWLPRAGEWLVDIEAAQPPVRRRKQVRIERPTGGGPARLEIELPATALYGRTVDRSGQSVAGAEVTVHSIQHPQEGRVDSFSDSQGRFELSALEEGNYFVFAEQHVDGAVSASASLHFSLTEGQRAGPLELVLEPRRRLELEINGPDSLLGGARVRLVPTQAVVQNWPNLVSDHMGRIEARVPADTRTFDVSVGAPGHALHIGRYSVEQGRILLSREGGTLHLALPPEMLVPGSERLPTLLHNGGAEAVGALRWWASYQGKGLTPGPQSVVTLPQMEPGRYVLCAFSRQTIAADMALAQPRQDACVDGYLADRGELYLSLE